MNKWFLQPSARLVGGLFAVSAMLLIASALVLNVGSADMAGFGYVLMLLGLIFLFIALAQFAMRKLNLKYPLER